LPPENLRARKDLSGKEKLLTLWVRIRRF
jgi:hypothetical protein